MRAAARKIRARYGASRVTMDAPINPHHSRTMAEHREPVDYSDQEVPEGTSFAGDVFPKGAIFRNAIFTGFADFTGTIFLGEVDFSGAVFLKGASFQNAQFGKPYNREFGDWEIRFFSVVEKEYVLKGRKKDAEWKKSARLKRMRICPNF
ncbi:MAG: pentapeptide repeat-containing protein [Nitrospinales bacterium]